jgi:lysyl-tRNA synthetase class 2
MTDKVPRPEQWWRPDLFAARRPRLEARMAMAQAVRGFFAERDFVEVETPALQVSPGLEPHLIAFATELREPFHDGAGRRLYLHTSPEFAMKKLLVAGVPRLYQLARVWRNAERSGTHHPEFTMLEWYRAGAGYRDLMADCEALLRAALAAAPADLRAGAAGFRRGGVGCDPAAPWQYISVAEAFRRYADVDVMATAPDPLAPDTRRLKDEAGRIGVWVGERDQWEDIFFRIFLARVEPRLGIGVPTVLYDYPLSMAALARSREDNPGIAERFELYVCGLELANGFSELTDAAEQRRRFEAEIAKKQALYGESYPMDEDFLAALAYGMPESAGIALGFDRLVMLATAAGTIDEVLWAPVVEAGAGP